MYDNPRIFLPGTPEFTQGFLFGGIKFLPPLVSDLIQSSCFDRNSLPGDRAGEWLEVPGWKEEGTSTLAM